MKEETMIPAIDSQRMIGKEDMKRYILEKLEVADYLEMESILGFILGLMG